MSLTEHIILCTSGQIFLPWSQPSDPDILPLRSGGTGFKLESAVVWEVVPTLSPWAALPCWLPGTVKFRALYLLQVFTHLLTVMDQTTGWPDAVPLSSMISMHMAYVFFFCLGCFGIMFWYPIWHHLRQRLTVSFSSQSELWSAVVRSLGM